MGIKPDVLKSVEIETAIASSDAGGAMLWSASARTVTNGRNTVARVAPKRHVRRPSARQERSIAQREREEGTARFDNNVFGTNGRRMQPKRGVTNQR
jgi:hypothetical protein